MILYDFIMNVRSTFLPVGGVGLVAVHLLHKKEHVAKELIDYYFRHFRNKKVPLLILYPFRPNFYRQMGFGYGTKINEYRVRSSAFKRGKVKSHLRFLDETNIEGLLDCYNRSVQRIHGMVLGSPREFEYLFMSSTHYVVGYEKNNSIKGFLAFHFERKVSQEITSIRVSHLIFDDRDALGEMLTFVHTQLDQFEWVTITTHDETFHHLLSDPRNASRNIIPHVHHESNVQAVGLMYRVLDVAGLFGALDDVRFGDVSCRLRIDVKDSFLAENEVETIIHFQNGRPILGEYDYEVSIELDISDFSSLVMGVISFKKLYQYGLAKISDLSFLETIHRLFWVEDKPICLTRF
jgi:predicted acetyltransferase